MKTTLALRTSQSLALTPQLQLAIRVLRMSALELADEIREATLSNPLLETTEGESATDADPMDSETWQAPDDASFESDLETGESNAGAGVDDGFGPNADDDREIADGALSGNLGGLASRDRSDEDDSRETAAGVGLKEHLWSQIACLGFGDEDLAIAAIMVDAIDDDGYVREEPQTVRDALGQQDLSDERIESVRRRLTQLDPTGVCARNLRECLLAQMDELPDGTPGLELARRLVVNHLDRLGDRAEAVCAQLGLSGDDYNRARHLVTSLDPRPGSRFGETATDQIIPDVEVYRDRGRWRVRLVEGSVPRLRLSSAYSGMVRARGNAEQAWLNARMQEARWLIRSVEQREETLLRVATAIVDHQGAFFDFGAQAMRPLSMRDIAERLELHESTVSRAVGHKYVATPRGTMELRDFFATGLATASGGSTSSTAIQSLIKHVIENEPADCALSDQALVAQLAAQGIMVARRTVAKYREALGIPPSHERQRAARR